MKHHKKRRRSLYRTIIRVYDRCHAAVWRARRSLWAGIMTTPDWLRGHQRQTVLVLKIMAGAEVLLLLAVLLVPAPVRRASHNLAVNDPVRVRFLYPVHGALAYSVSPTVAGAWVVHRDALGITGADFKPARPLRPKQTYTVTVTGVRSLSGVLSAGTKAVSFATRDLPPVALARPAVTQDVSPTTDIAVAMQYANAGTRRLALTGVSELVSAYPASRDDKLFIWHFAHPLAQGATYTMELRDLNLPANQQILRRIRFTTVSEPRVASATTGGMLYPGNPVKIVFADKMVRSSNAFTFDCVGAGKWQDDHTYVFMPATLLPDSTCDYTLHKGTRSQAGGVIEKDRQFGLGSPGALQVTSFSPSGTGLGLQTGIAIVFNQPVDRVAAQNAFHLNPESAGKFTWDGNTLTFVPAGLAYQTEYTVSLDSGIASVYGLSSVQSYVWHFSTTPQTVKLSVPAYRQDHALGSAVTALRMALSYRGVNVTDDDVLNAIGYSPEVRDAVGNYWTDPYILFVGDIDGSPGVTGWGVLAPPVSLAAQKLGRNAVYLANMTVNQISQAIHDGDVVIVWGVKAGESPHMDTWNTANGPVTVPDNAEVRVVYGVTGSVASPLTFFMHDPAAGDLQWSAAQLQSSMTAGGQIAAQGVVVY